MLDFCERVPEVGDFDVVGSVQKKILRLEIAVQEAGGMQVLQEPQRLLRQH
jgi:hypothetical protein